MLPIQIQSIRNQLMHWGYFRYNVQRMPTWDLLSFYSLEKDKPHHIFLPVVSPVGKSDAPAEPSTSSKYIDIRV